MTMQLYGTEDYVYYYKGHPGYPTALYPERQDYFESLKEQGCEIYELDNAIAAEIILFFNPEVNVVGYQTSTFDSLEESDSDKAFMIFGQRLGNFNSVYKDLFAAYSSVVNEDVRSELIEKGIELDSTKNYFIIEYNNANSAQLINYNKHEIAVYNASDNVFNFFKLTDGVYKEVDQEGNIINN